MKKRPFRLTPRMWIPLLAGTALLPVPLLGNFHIESALLAALVGCFWAGWKGCQPLQRRGDGRRIARIFGSLYLAALPLALYALLSGCLSLHGVGFWLLYPAPSVLFGYAAGRLLRMWQVPFRKLLMIMLLLLVAVGVFLFEFMNFPQVYFFNHVWGGWPGPIYDETVTVGYSLLFFRLMTLLWAGVLWVLPSYRTSRISLAAAAGGLLLLTAGYTQLAEMGIITPRPYLQQQLGGAVRTPHFVLYYDPDYYSDDAITYVGRRHEFHYSQLSERLKLAPADAASPIESYLYAHPWQKKALVGAKFTSYVPVWLDQDQLHIAKPQIGNSLRHELVHVLSKRFGNRLYNASWSIGLVEGVAVALAPETSSVSTVDQIVAANRPYPSVREMREALSPLGFYGGRSAVNYTQTGSFVQYLLNNYPAADFKAAYPDGDIARAYDRPLDSLVAGWHRHLAEVTVDSADRQTAARLYSLPSLFEQDCPRVQSDFARSWDRFRLFMAQGDTVQALQWLGKARQAAPSNPFVANQWAYLNLKAGRYAGMEEAAADTTAEGQLLAADALALQGKGGQAGPHLERAARLIKSGTDTGRALHAALRMRRDSLQWHWYRQVAYHQRAVPDSLFGKVGPRVRIRALRLAMEQENWGQLNQYARLAVEAPSDVLYFSDYIDLVEMLAYYVSRPLAEQWAEKLAALPLRARHRQQLHEARAWIRFLGE